jgi:predicted ATPase
MIHLKSVTIRKWKPKESTRFPFSLPILQSLSEIEFTAPVTFFVGENGTGKSSLLEAIACAVESITVGSESVKTDKSLATVRKFSQQLKLAWNKRTRRGFFLRAEDFFGYARNMAKTQRELEEDLKAVDKDYKGRSQLAINLAKMPYNRELRGIEQRYGAGLDVSSHGESFLKLFQSRFVPDGLYLLDEPEAPLSPTRQLAFLAALKQMVAQDSQFIIATHSPIIMAFPDAVILSFDSAKIYQVKYSELEHVNFTRAFLNNPEAFLRHL